MSWSWQLVRGSSVNPSSLKFAALINKQNTTENELFTPESNKPNILSVNTDDLTLLQDPLHFQKLVNKTTYFRGPFEPDGVVTKYWCLFDHLARKIKDHSFSGNVTYPVGEPQLCDGPDDGIRGGSIVTRINHGHQGDYFYTPSTSDLLSTMGSGFSIYLAFIADDIVSADGNYDTTLHYKYDDANNLRCITIDDDGDLKFWVKKGGVDFVYETEANTITPNTVYRCCFTFNPNDNSQQMMINGKTPADVGNSLVSISGSTTDMVHGRRGGIDGGYFQGKLLESRFYKIVFHNEHMKNIWNNWRSICAQTSIEFDGTGDKMGLGNLSSLWSQSLTKFSFGLWFFADVNTGFRTLVNHGAGSTGSFQLITNNLDIAFKMNFGAGDTNIFGPFLHGRWNYAFCVYDSTLGSNQQKLYLNGVILAQGESGHGAVNLSSVLELGAEFDGNVRDFRWFGPSTALSEANILKSMYNRPDAPTPDYWLKMNEGAGTPIDCINGNTTSFVNNTNWELHTSHLPIAYGSIAVAGYSRFHDTLYEVGYDSVGYDSTGYDTA